MENDDFQDAALLIWSLIFVFFKIVDVSGRGKSIAMDWVGRDLYWLEEEPQGYCEIKTFNIDRRGSTNNRVLQMDMSGSNLAVHPYKRWDIGLFHTSCPVNSFFDFLNKVINIIKLLF